MPPVKNLRYDFLRRHYPHQVKGRSSSTSSQPADTSSPVFMNKEIVHLSELFFKWFDENRQELLLLSVFVCLFCKYFLFKH